MTPDELHLPCLVGAQIIEHDDESLLLSSHSDVSTGTMSSNVGSSFSQLVWLEAALSCAITHPNIVQTYDCQSYDPLAHAQRATGISMRGVRVSHLAFLL
jgi:hypothetical protein